MQIYYLVKRNTLNFFRDRSAVFFSVLSTLIILALMVVFMGSSNSASVVDVLAQFGGERDTLKDTENAKHLIQMWTLAGILVVNSVTVTLTAIGCMVSDETRNRLASFYVAPIKRIKIAWAVICTLIAIGLCIAVCHEWNAQGDCKPFSMIAGCIVYIAGSVGLFICGKEFADYIDYWFGNGDIYYKGGKK